MDQEFLHHLPADAIDALADKREQEARELRAVARERCEQDRRRQERERFYETIEATVKMVCELIEHQRKSYDAAIHAAAKFSGVQPITIEWHLSQFMKKRDRRARLVKDAAVMGLIRAGQDNQTIAGRLNLHPNTVSNIKAKVMNP